MPPVEFTFGSLFAGLGAFCLGAEHAGWRCRWQVEICPDARRVLDARFPDVPKFRDIRECGAHNLETIDLVIGGFPCQSLSTAGKQEGFAEGSKSAIFFEMCRVLSEVRPTFVLWENVPNLLSGADGDDEGCDGEQEEAEEEGPGTGLGAGRSPVPSAAGPVPWMATVLRHLRLAGYRHGVWRVLDGRHFGVAQRRRRVFGLFARADAGVGARLALSAPRLYEGGLAGLLAEVLLEPGGVRRHPETRRGARANTAARTGGGAAGGGGGGGRTFAELGEGHQTYQESALACALRTGEGGGAKVNNLALEVFQASGAGAFRAGSPSLAASDDNGTNQVVVSVTGGDHTHALTSVGADSSEDGTGRGTPIVCVPRPFPSPDAPQVLAFSCKDDGRDASGEVSPTLRAMTHDKSHANGGGQVAIAFYHTAGGQSLAATDDCAPPVKVGNSVGTSSVAVAAYIAPRICRNQRGKSSNQVGIKDGALSDALTGEGPGAVAFHLTQDPIAGEVAPAMGKGGESGCASVGDVGAPSYTLDTLSEHAVAYQCHGSNVGPLGTLRAGNGNEAGGVPFVAQPIPIDMRQASRGDKMTNNRKEGSSGGAPGTGVGAEGDPSPSLAETHTPAVAVAFTIHGTPASEVASEADVIAALRARAPGGVDNSTTNVVVQRQQPTVAFHLTQDPITGTVAPAMGKGNESGRASVGVAYGITRDALDRTGEGSGGTPGERSGLGVLDDDSSQVVKAKGPNAVAYNIVGLAHEGRNHAYETTVSGCLQHKGLNPTGNEAGTVICFQERGRADGRTLEVSGEDVAYALTSPAGGGRRQEKNVCSGMIVRRLTPTECLRLQALLDDQLDLDPPLSDSAKYRLVGNSGVTTIITYYLSRLRRRVAAALEEGP